MHIPQTLLAVHPMQLATLHKKQTLVNDVTVPFPELVLPVVELDEIDWA